MKTKMMAVAALVAGMGIAMAAEKIKAPNGGRIVGAVKPPAEFLLTPERKVEVRFLDEAGKVITPGDQVVTVTTGERSSPVKLAFVKEGDKLVSDKAVPEGDKLPVILQIKAKEGEKAVSEKFTLNLAKCPECELAEYACSCEHAEDDHGHDHKEGDGHKH